MELTMDYEFLPAGAVLIHSGDIKQDDGGAWVPVVYQVGPARYQCGVIPPEEKNSAVLHRAVLTDLKLALHVADALARLAAA